MLNFFTNPTKLLPVGGSFFPLGYCNRKEKGGPGYGALYQLSE